MPNWVAANGLHYVKEKEPVRGSKKYLRPKDVGMDPKGYETKEAAIEAEQELKRRVQELYNPTTKKTTPSTLLPLLKMWLKSLEGQVKGHDTLPKKARFAQEILSRWGDINVSDVKVFMVQRYLDERARKFSANLASSILKKEGATIAELQLFLRHESQKTTEIYAGHLDNSTKVQNELLGRVWAKQRTEAAKDDACV